MWWPARACALVAEPRARAGGSRRMFSRVAITNGALLAVLVSACASGTSDGRAPGGDEPSEETGGESGSQSGGRGSGGSGGKEPTGSGGTSTGGTPGAGGTPAADGG